MELKEVVRAAKILLTKALHLNAERPDLQVELKPILNEIHDILNRLRRIKWREEAFKKELNEDFTLLIWADYQRIRSAPKDPLQER